jgi:hypothetical protein
MPAPLRLVERPVEQRLDVSHVPVQILQMIVDNSMLADPKSQDDRLRVRDCVDNPILAQANTIEALEPSQLLAALGARVAAERFQDIDHSALVGLSEGTYVLLRRGQDLDAVRHAWASFLETELEPELLAKVLNAHVGAVALVLLQRLESGAKIDEVLKRLEKLSVFD